MSQFADSLASLSRGEITVADVVTYVDRLCDQGAVDQDTLITDLNTSAGGRALNPQTRAAIEQRIRGWSPTSSPAPPAMADLSADDDRTRIAPPRPKEVGVGSIIKGRFQLETLLGAGGMGKVFKALDLRRVEARDRQAHVAIKLLSESFRQHSISVIALQREAKKALNLAHPNIVRVFDFDREGEDLYFMTMEYLSGRPLDKVIKEAGTGLPFDRAMGYIRPVAAALGYAHENNIVHSDFKPNNVFVTDEGHVKVIDFGIARAIKRPDDTDTERTVFDAKELGALTPPYASPEMCDRLDPDPRDDIYALGCVAYELLTGRHPFHRLSGKDARDQKLDPAAPANLSKKQWAALKRALAFERNQRSPSVEAFITELTGGAPAKQAKTVATAAPASKPFPLAAVGGGVALLAVAGVLAFVFIGGEKDQADGSSSKLVVENEAPKPVEKPPIIDQKDIVNALKPTPEPVVPPPSEPVVTKEPPQPLPVEPEPQVAVVTPLPSPPTLGQIRPMLQEVSCAFLDASLTGGDITLTGYARRRADVEDVAGRLKAMPGVTQVSSKVEAVLLDPHCTPLATAEPLVRINRAGARGLSMRPTKSVFVGGDKLRININAPTANSYVYVDYFDHDGGVLHMLPRPGATNNFLPGKSGLRLGDGGVSGDWTIGEPYGKDLLVVWSLPEAMFTGTRPEYEERSEEYLQLVRGSIDRIASRHGKGTVLAEFALILTKPQ
jgi:hypothetical protein